MNYNSTRLEICIRPNGGSVVPWIGTILILFTASLYMEIHTWKLVCLALAAMAIFVYKVFFEVASETVLIVAGLGVQTTSVFLTGRIDTQFYSWNSIIDITILETITMQRVLFYMALLVQPNSSDNKILVPLFLSTWPNLQTLQVVYTHCQSLLKLGSQDTS